MTWEALFHRPRELAAAFQRRDRGAVQVTRWCRLENAQDLRAERARSSHRFASTYAFGRVLDGVERERCTTVEPRASTVALLLGATLDRKCRTVASIGKSAADRAIHHY